MVLQGMTQPPFQVVLTAEYGAQPASYKAIQDREDRTLRVFKVVEPALEHGIQLGNDTQRSRLLPRDRPVLARILALIAVKLFRRTKRRPPSKR